MWLLVIVCLLLPARLCPCMNVAPAPLAGHTAATALGFIGGPLAPPIEQGRFRRVPLWKMGNGSQEGESPGLFAKP